MCVTVWLYHPRKWNFVVFSYNFFFFFASSQNVAPPMDYLKKIRKLWSSKLSSTLFNFDNKVLFWLFHDKIQCKRWAYSDKFRVKIYIHLTNGDFFHFRGYWPNNHPIELRDVCRVEYLLHCWCEKIKFCNSIIKQYQWLTNGKNEYCMRLYMHSYKLNKMFINLLFLCWK